MHEFECTLVLTLSHYKYIRAVIARNLLSITQPEKATVEYKIIA